ncbi:MAG: PAS domain-containing protein, partial [Chloroflexota bacterium]|nr:PAS domain-containing protein [Chloroflexota bacterium]
MNKCLEQEKDSQSFDFLTGGGEMGKLMRSVDWSKTPVGPVGAWSQSLKTTIRMLLSAKFGMFLWWGPDLVQFYNDSYRPSFGTEGEKHPKAMGQAGKECWAEIWDIIYPQIEQVMTTGVATRNEDQLVPIYRNGILEEVYWTYTYGPIYEESGNVGGVLVVETETTKQVIDARRIKLLRDLAIALTNAKSVTQVCKSSIRVLARDPHDIPFASLYLLSKDKKQLQLTAGTGLEKYPLARPSSITRGGDRGNLRSVWDALESGKALEVQDLTDQFGELTCGPWLEAIHTQYILPLTPPNLKEPIGVLIAGVSSRRALDRDYKDFLELAARQITSGIATATTHGLEIERQNELEKARAEAEAARQRLRDLFMQAPAFVAVISGPKLVFEIANPLYHQLVGKDRVLDGRPLLEAIPDIEPSLLKIVKNVARKGERFVANELPVLLDWDYSGQAYVKYLNLVYEPILDKSRAPNGLMCIGYEVTEQVQARKRVEEGEERFRILANNIQDLAWMANPNGWILWYNQRWSDYTGTTLEEIDGWGREKVHPDHIERVAAFVEEAWKKGEPWELTFPLRGQDGHYRWFLTRASPVRDKDGSVVCWIGTNTNIDEQKRAQEAIERSEARFRA